MTMNNSGLSGSLSLYRCILPRYMTNSIRHFNINGLYLSKYNGGWLYRDRTFSIDKRFPSQLSHHDSTRDTSLLASSSGTHDSQLDVHTSDSVVETSYEIEYCNEILSDPVSDVSLEETAKFLIPYPNCDRTHLFDYITRPFSYMFEPAVVMIQLCVERLENEELTNKFAISPGFNDRAYFLFLHIWLLHRRAMKELPLGILLDRYLFRCAFELLSEWLVKRGIPEHRFKSERENCQAFMMKFLVELDQCTLDEDLYAYKISRTLHYHLYEENIDEQTLCLLVKYIMRQFTHISNLESKHFLDAMFLWADHESICKPQRLLKRAMPQLIKYGGESIIVFCHVIQVTKDPLRKQLP
uniref:Ubiquinol-cytochrome c chaperone domain-containing protein n=1 Tax=Babesia bovis TaxID=5865 RepID=A7ANC5_BABBO|eukprot:XP_001611627.1 hypothetical protein [Babesia bovis T2Bo]